MYKDPNLKLSYKDLKEAVADALYTKTQEFIQKRNDLLQHKKDIKNQIKYSSSEIRKIAQETLKEVKELCGLQNVKF
jgi:tryptophanyl-tRNA synthetase